MEIQPLQTLLWWGVKWGQWWLVTLIYIAKHDVNRPASVKMPFITGSKKETLCFSTFPGNGSLTCVIISSLTQQLSHRDGGMPSLSHSPTHQDLRVLQSAPRLCSTSYRFSFQPCQPHLNLHTFMSSISIKRDLKCNIFYCSERFLMTAFLLGMGIEINLPHHCLV